MAMGKRTSEQAPMWVASTDLPVSPGHPFYARLNAILDAAELVDLELYLMWRARGMTFEAPAVRP